MLSGDRPAKKLKQSSLHEFLGLQDYRVPGYFHLDWENKVALFLPKTPLGIQWQGDFLWRQASQEISVRSRQQLLIEIAHLYYSFF